MIYLFLIGLVPMIYRHHNLAGQWAGQGPSRCDKRPSCGMAAALDPEVQEDPCPGTEKYLEAHYLCHSLVHGPPTTGPGTEEK